MCRDVCACRERFACRTRAVRASLRHLQRSRRWPRVGLVLIIGLSLWGALLVPVVPVQAQGDGPLTGERHVQVWARKLASGNVEFGLRVSDPSDGSITDPPLTKRYFLYNSSTLVVDRWYYSEPVKVGEGSGSAVLEVMARRLAEGSVEFGMRIDGHDIWFPLARSFPYRTSAVDSLFLSSVFRTQSESSECSNGIAVPNPESNLGLVRDCMALLDALQLINQSALYQRNRGIGINWSSNLPISSWRGVGLTASTPERVDELRLVGLAGAFPPDFFRLEELTSLDLSNSQIVGEIPAEISQAKNLTTLYIPNSGLSGKIPASLGSLSKLKWLGLGHNNLSGSIPSELGNLSNLASLRLDENNLSGPIPSSLGNLSNLVEVNLDGNNLSGPIPSSLGNLSNLTSLTLRQNNLSGPIPSELGNLSNLIKLELNGNNLSGPIPLSLGNLSELTHFELQENELNGTLPESLQNLAKLELLNVSDNELSVFGLTSMSGMTKLRVLDLGGNNFFGQLPTAVGTIPGNRVSVDFSDNNFSGEIPLGLVSDGLHSLDLSSNNLTGGIPLDIRTRSYLSGRSPLGNESYLSNINLSNNRLSGPIPTDWADRFIGIRYGDRITWLSGPIPTDWAYRSIPVDIHNLSLTGNDLNISLVGRDPTVVTTDFGFVLIGGLYLSLAGNAFSGNIPPGLGDVTALRFLDLGNNSLSGGIPAQLGNLTYLEGLYLNDNGLTGSVPTQLGDLVSLGTLHLQGNTGLTGCVPVSLETYVTRSNLLNLSEPEPRNADVQVPPSLMNNGAVRWCAS